MINDLRAKKPMDHTTELRLICYVKAQIVHDGLYDLEYVDE